MRVASHSTISPTAQAPLVSPPSGEVTQTPRAERPGVESNTVNDLPPRRLGAALELLLQAQEYARSARRDLWDFAVEVAELGRRGMTNADCRWFACNGWMEFGRELKPRPGEARRFDRNVGLVIHRHTCLVLTAAGEHMARELAASLSVGDGAAPHEMHGSLVPRWDRDRHELFFGPDLIKQFKLPSPNQEMILVSFEEERWPARIDDPLPPSKEIAPKSRLHDTIKNLNRNQKQRLLRFMGDGTGQGVRWEPIFHNPPVSAPTPPDR